MMSDFKFTYAELTSQQKNDIKTLFDINDKLAPWKIDEAGLTESEHDELCKVQSQMYQNLNSQFVSPDDVLDDYEVNYSH